MHVRSNAVHAGDKLVRYFHTIRDMKGKEWIEEIK